MQKSSFSARIRYWFDNIMAKGTGALMIMLLGITAVVVLVIGVLSWLLNAQVFGSLGDSIWQNLMHALDAGTLAGLPTDSGVLFVALMMVTTVCGIFITSMLIGIINSGLEQKFESLRRGNSKVIEVDHTVILGFDSRIFTTITELAIANENRKKARIVVLGDEDKQVMDETIRAYIPNLKNTVVICRSGSTMDAVALESCSLESCRSIIINESNDAKTIRTILATTNYLKAYPENRAHITAVVQEENNVEIACIAGEGRAEILFFADAMSRIIAHTCRQPGLSHVYSELFSFAGNEIYMEPFSALTGKTFGQLLTLFAKSCLIGMKRDGQVFINPPMDTVVLGTDELIIIAQDDGATTPLEHDKIEQALMVKDVPKEAPYQASLLVLGRNGLLTGIVEELDCYVQDGSRITVACEHESALAEAENIKANLKHVTLVTEFCNICDRRILEKFVAQGYHNIVILSDTEADASTADSTTLMVLMYLRDISKKNHAEFSITSEMQDLRNQELARTAHVNDFVVSSNLTSLMTAQISENRLLRAVFTDLLDAEGSEIYLKPAKNYVVTGQPVNFFTVTQAAANKGEIFIGYKDITRTGEHTQTRVILNPDKNETMSFDDKDQLIVIAEQ